MNKVKLLTFLLLLFTQMSIAQKLTLQQAVKRAVEETNAIKVERSKVAIAKNALTAVKDARLPDVSVSGTYMYLPIKPNVNMKFAQSSSSTSGETSSSGGSGLASVNPKSAMFGSLKASYPIFTGFKLKNNLVKANKVIDLAQLSENLSQENIAWNTVNDYFEILKSHQEKIVLVGNLAKTENRVKDFTNFLNNGIIAENDLLRVKLQKSNVQLALDQVVSNMEGEQYKFNTMLNLDPNTPIDFEISSLLNTSSPAFGTDISQRKDLALYDKQAEINNSDVNIARGNIYPNLALTAGWIGLNVPQVISVPNAFNVGIGFSYNISSLYKNNTQVKAAQLQLLHTQEQKQVALDNAKIEMNDAIRNYQLSMKKSLVLKEALAQANENLRIVNNKSKNGLVNTDELLDADVQQLQSEINYRNSLLDQQLAYYGILYKNGTLLDYLNK